ncbi:hypothetical protein MUO66_02425 [Candidatus Bathyarchaeota archaeon]|nr:hypothetical protein [Candidatus Bathyarchaeota archaeon]
MAFASEGYSGNNCLIFNGDDYYAVCGQSTIYQLDNCTIEMWIKPEHTIQTGSDSLYGHNLGYLVNRINTMSGDGYALRFDYRSGSL